MGEQFILCQDDLGNYEIRYDDKIFHFLWEVAPILNEQQAILNALKEENDNCKNDYRELFSNYVALEEKNEQLQEEIKRLEKMIWKIQWRFQQEVGIEKAKEHYQEIDKEMEE